MLGCSKVYFISFRWVHTKNNLPKNFSKKKNWGGLFNTKSFVSQILVRGHDVWQFYLLLMKVNWGCFPFTRSRNIEWSSVVIPCRSGFSRKLWKGPNSHVAVFCCSNWLYASVSSHQVNLCSNSGNILLKYSTIA